MAKTHPHSLIIGGTRGIGRALARRLAADGHVVSVVGRRASSGESVSGTRYWSVDLTETESTCASLSGIIAEQGPLNNLVFLQRFKGAGDKWRGELETSLTATKCVIEHLAGHFAAGANNSIVLVSSAAGNVIADEQPVGYHVAKAGLNQMARYFAVTLGGKGIRVNTVSPGTVIKEENRGFYARNKRLVEVFRQAIPLGRMGTAEEIASVIAFLCSAQSSFITGQNLLVDGGISLLSQETLLHKFTKQSGPFSK
jgi:NAD(P)-dependent dehydrogenase (short-subunit alcohol dehydrogenase family)